MSEKPQSENNLQQDTNSTIVRSPVIDALDAHLERWYKKQLQADAEKITGQE